MDWFDQALAMFKRIGIAGGPRTGKTTLSERVADRPVVHTDDFMHLPWSLCPLAVRDKLQGLPTFVVEGVQVPRTLRKGLIVDAVIWLDKSLAQPTRGQAAMAKGVMTVFQEWRQSNMDIPILIPPTREQRAALPKIEYPK